MDMPALSAIDRAFPALTAWREKAKPTDELPDEFADDASAHGIALVRLLAIQCTGEFLTADGQKLRIVDKKWDRVNEGEEITPELITTEDLAAIREAVESFGEEAQADAEPFPATGEPGNEVAD